MNNESPEVPLLFTPIQLRSVVARNRIVSSPMCQYASDDGGPEEWQLVNFGRFAMGGCGIVFGEESAVEARGRKTHHCADIYKDSHVPAYRRITEYYTVACCASNPHTVLHHPQVLAPSGSVQLDFLCRLRSAKALNRYAAGDRTWKVRKNGQFPDF